MKRGHISFLLLWALVRDGNLWADELEKEGRSQLWELVLIFCQSLALRSFLHSNLP